MSILFLDEVGKDDVARAGGKGANLGELLQNGFPIPAGFVVSSECYAAAIKRVQVDADAAQISTALTESDIPAQLADAIHAAHDKIQAHRQDPVVYAVRSSATAEDSGHASFAGQHATFYPGFPFCLPRMAPLYFTTSPSKT